MSLSPGLVTRIETSGTIHMNDLLTSVRKDLVVIVRVSLHVGLEREIDM